jgi:hypothetical protein
MVTELFSLLLISYSNKPDLNLILLDKTMKNIIIALIVIFFSYSSSSLGRAVSYEEIKGDLFSTIRNVTPCGTYSDGKSIGEMRLIETYTYGGIMIFIDTIVLGGPGLVYHTSASIKEINNDHFELDIEEVSCKDLGNNQIQVTGKVTGSGHDETLSYNLNILYQGYDGSYKYKETFNK